MTTKKCPFCDAEFELTENPELQYSFEGMCEDGYHHYELKYYNNIRYFQYAINMTVDNCSQYIKYEYPFMSNILDKEPSEELIFNTVVATMKNSFNNPLVYPTPPNPPEEPIRE